MSFALFLRINVERLLNLRMFWMFDGLGVLGCFVGIIMQTHEKTDLHHKIFKKILGSNLNYRFGSKIHILATTRIYPFTNPKKIISVLIHVDSDTSGQQSVSQTLEPILDDNSAVIYLCYDFYFYGRPPK